MKRYILFLILGLTLLPQLNLAQGSVFKKTEKPKNLHFALLYEFKDSYDPVEHNYVYFLPLFRCLYSTLYRLNDKMQPYPFLVEVKEEKGKSVLLRLKKGAKFSDGSPITSKDVIYSIEAAMKHKTYPNPVYKLIEGGEAFFRGNGAHCSGLTIHSPTDFEIRLKEENIEFAHYFATPIMSILPADRNKNAGGKARKMAFSGAFMLERYKRTADESIVRLKRNPHYKGKKPKIDGLVFHYYSDKEAYYKKLQKGAHDMFLSVRYQQLPATISPEYNFFKTPTFGAFYFFPNPSQGPFRDKGLRKFFKYYIRARKFVTNPQWDSTIPANMVLPYSLPGYFLFNQIDYRDFTSFIPEKPVTIKCVNAVSGIRPSLFTQLKKELVKYNIRLELSWDNLPNIETMQKAGTVHLTSLYYLVDVPLSSYFYEVMFTPGNELNLYRYEVPEALKVLEAHRKEPDQLKRLRLLSRLEEIAQEEAFIIPLLNPLAILGYKNRVKNCVMDKYLNIKFEEIELDVAK